MITLEDLRPNSKNLVINLLDEAGVDVSHWRNYRGKHASQHPNSYNWSFEQLDELIVVAIWHAELDLEDGKIVHRRNMRLHDGRNDGKGKAQRKVRAGAFDRHVQKAFILGIPIRAILCEGERRNAEEEEPTSSKVQFRKLDPEPWAVTSYDFQTGDCVLTRGVSPIAEADEDQPEFSGFEGEIRRCFVLHRRREAQMRMKKIMDSKYRNNGHLICEVPKCGFDFESKYGSIGKNFAHVHHLTPLSKLPLSGQIISLRDLAIVCANCHAMIHVGGQCRPLESLIA